MLDILMFFFLFVEYDIGLQSSISCVSRHTIINPSPQYILTSFPHLVLRHIQTLQSQQRKWDIMSKSHTLTRVYKCLIHLKLPYIQTLFGRASASSVLLSNVEQSPSK